MMAKDASERNYFAYQSAASRYASARPYFHPLVIGKIKDYLQLQEPLQRALDIGCGTGQSTIELKEIANDIVGTDISQEMLNEAPSGPRIQYLRTPAEQLPLPDASFDLVTVALAFHWFDQSRFLAEARRVLRPSGWLVTSVDGFGTPGQKIDDYRIFDKDQLIQYPGFKLFYRLDKPLMSPSDVLGMSPAPLMVMYQ